MNNKLTKGNQCGECGYNHLPPMDGIDRFKWDLERTAGYHTTACSNVSPINSMGISKEQALKCLEILNGKYFQ